MIGLDGVIGFDGDDAASDSAATGPVEDEGVRDDCSVRDDCRTKELELNLYCLPAYSVSRWKISVWRPTSAGVKNTSYSHASLDDVTSRGSTSTVPFCPTLAVRDEARSSTGTA